MDPADRRQYTRLPFAIFCRVERPPSTFMAQTRDVSENSAYLITSEKLVEGTPCRVEAFLDGTDQPARASMACQVVRVDGSGFAVRLEPVDHESRFHWNEVVRFLNGTR